MTKEWEELISEAEAKLGMEHDPQRPLRFLSHPSFLMATTRWIWEHWFPEGGPAEEDSE